MISCARRHPIWNARRLLIRCISDCAAQRLKDDGHGDARPELLRRLLRSIAADGRGEGGEGGSIAVRSRDADTVDMTLQREWGLLVKTAEIRRAAAQRLLGHLLSTLSPASAAVPIYWPKRPSASS